MTGKEHMHVMRDTRTMLDGLGKDKASFGAMYTDSYGRQQPAYALPKDLTITLVSGYDVVRRHQISVIRPA